MAEMQENGRRTAPATGKSIATILNLSGAAVSLALVVGVGIWGYKLVTRDVSGVPVVRAAEGPMRVQPEDPGGAPAENQGLAVNKVAALGTAEKPADRLVLAPKPIDLTVADDPSSSVAAIETEVGQEDTAEAAESPAEGGNMSVEALVNQLMLDAKPLGAESAEATVQAVALKQEDVTAPAPLAVSEETEAAVARVAGGIGRSLRPRPRPANAAQLVALKAPASPTRALEVAADSLPAGTRLAQLGAFESEEIARKEWDRLSGRFGDFLGDKQRVIQKAESGGRTFYRLRAHGFGDINDARRFCSALLAEKAECIPVTTK